MATPPARTPQIERKEGMNAGPTQRQPSNFVLCATALLCGSTLLWAYRDRASRLAAESYAPPRTTQSALPELKLSPSWIDAVDPPAAPPAGPLLIPAPPASDAEEAPAAVVDAAPWLPAADELNADRSSDEELEVLVPTPTRLDPRDLFTEEQSVLVAPPAPAAQPAAPSVASAPTPKPVTARPAPPAAEITPIGPSDEDAYYEDDAAALVASTPHDELLTYTPAATEISQRVIGEVQTAFALGRHGALYAARGRFIEVIRVIALAKDAEQSTDRYSRALDEGLTALAEAQDFLPGGVVSKELSVAEVAASHRTPMLRGKPRSTWALPQEAAAMYYRYAEQKLATAVAGEQAGSMALYGLGKTHDRLAAVENSSAERQISLAMHRAAITAHHGNHLASNELGVGLARVGRYEKAAAELQKSINQGGGSTVYHNLAHVQHKLGQPRLAAESARQAERIASRERAAGEFSRQRGVEWVAPDELARQSSPAGAPPQPQPQSPPTIAAAPAPPEPDRGGPLSGVTRFAKRILVGEPAPAAAPAISQPMDTLQSNRTASPARSQTTIR
ncbi:hypothetical protein KOR34_16700 [Posidoniimonas corsicana]|uniref:Tetratricopeptide repeat protein n=2 Tax=Posidoniimonas corsicana TaxID=1938618 RepID=A0A5C5VFQ7_9BACT|nr:hypothetical protein KOR34_16700 [Posidoniimonas corsicana]